MNHWKELVAISNNKMAQTTIYTTYDNKEYTWAETAKIHLNQLNTASGAKLKPGIETFVNDFKKINQ